MLQGQTHSVHFFSILQFSVDPKWAHFPKLQTIVLYAVCYALATTYCSCNNVCLLLLAARIISSTHCTVASVASQQGDLVGYHLRLSNVLQRISLPSCKSLYAKNISHSKQEIFIYENRLHWVLLPIETHKKTLFFGSIVHKHGSYFDYWNQYLNMRMHVCYIEF
jgi:hypothetical protein